MARPLTFDRAAALETAMSVFWANGYCATSVQDLQRAMQLSKSSFYQSYGSKRALYRSAILRYREIVTHDMEEALHQAPSGRAFLENIFEEFVKPNRRETERGCFVMNCANESPVRDADTAVLVRDGLRQFEDIFYRAVVRAQEEGDVDSSRDARALARYLVSSRGGLKTLAKADVNRRMLRDIVSVIHSTLGW